MKTSTERREDFLKDYEQAIRKHGIAITSCGCSEVAYCVDMVKPDGRIVEEEIEINLETLRRDKLS